MSNDCTTHSEITHRISRASQAFQALNRLLWYQRKIKPSTKMRIFLSVIIPTLLYSLECTVVSQPQVDRLQRFVMKCLRIILRISVRDQQRNTSIRKKAKIPRLSTLLLQRRLRFLGHLIRLDDERLPKQLLVCTLSEGGRRPGGQKLRWNDLISQDLKRCGLSDDWRSQALDRKKWQHVVRECTTRVNEEDELREKGSKDEKKKRRENHQIAEESALHCSETGCTFTALNRAGLVNHHRQVHTQPHHEACINCGRLFKKQGLHNHQRFCSKQQQN